VELSTPPIGTPSVPAPASALRASVVVPARDEELLLPACLDAIAHQEGIDAAEYEVIVVLDGCADRTPQVVEQVEADHPALRLLTTEGPGRGAGPARATGMDLACERLEEAGRTEGLIATTDADTIVAGDWLVRQLEAVEAGARAIGGEVLLDDTSAERLPAAVRRRREVELRNRVRLAERHGPAEHAHFSGASLGLTPQAYRAVGGMAWVAALEDQDLEDRLVEARIPIHRLSPVRVTTSARTDGRAERGLAKDLALADWIARRSFDGRGYGPEALLGAKSGTVGLILPAREVATTIGPILDALGPLKELGLLDEILVIDADSADGTASVARERGVRVASESETLPWIGPCLGKGDAMWRAARIVERDILVFVDADTADFGADFVLRLLGPIFLERDVRLVKGAFSRPFLSRGTAIEDEGGRVTELTARPLLNLHYPELAGFRQPLAGEMAIERSLFRQLEVPVGYGVEIAMLIDSLRLCGLDALAQVDLGTRQNTHQSLRDLSAMALQVMVAAERRGGVKGLRPNRARLTMPSVDGSTETHYVHCEERRPW
jgi:glucosyl-3-phosphoglycerate synthase